MLIFAPNMYACGDLNNIDETSFETFNNSACQSVFKDFLRHEKHKNFKSCTCYK